MMKILYVLNDTFRNGGTESVILNYYNNINREFFRIDFMLHTTEEEAESNTVCQRIKESGSKVFCVTPRSVSVIQNKKDIFSVLQHEKYDVVHAHADAVNGYILSIAKKCGVRTRIAHSHNTQIPIEPQNLKSIMHILFLEVCRIETRFVATHFMACSDDAARWMFGKNNTDNGKVYILNNAVNAKKYAFNQSTRDVVREKLGIDNELLLGHVGRFSKQKNHEFIFKVFCEIKKRKEDAKLLLVGEGKEKERIIEYARSLDLEESTIFYGNSNEVNDLLQAMDIFIFPSLYEGLGVALLEAQASGLSCLVSDSDKVSKKSKVTDLVHFLPLDDPTIWAEAILSHRNDQRKDCSTIIEKAGYDIVKEAKKLEKYYSDVWSKEDLEWK